MRTAVQLLFQCTFSPCTHRLLKDIQIDAFVKLMESQRLGHVLRDCEIVDEFKDSGRVTAKATDDCTLEEIQRAMKR